MILLVVPVASVKIHAPQLHAVFPEPLNSVVAFIVTEVEPENLNAWPYFPDVLYIVVAEHVPLDAGRLMSFGDFPEPSSKCAPPPEPPRSAAHAGSFRHRRSRRCMVGKRRG